MKKIGIIITFLTLLASQVYSQEKKNRLDFNVDLKTNHLWRGLAITDQPMAAANIHYTLDKKEHFKVGIWGGSSFSSEYSSVLGRDSHYQEIDYYVQYSNKGFTIGLWDLFNTRNVESPDIGDYDKDTSTHILDLRTSYRFGEKFPLRLEADVLLFGTADQNVEGDARYSTYVEAGYPVIRNQKVNLDAFVGAGFSLDGDTHLYGDGERNFDIVNLGVTASKTLNFGKYSLPVSATGMWNPSQGIARVQVAASVF